MYRLIESIKFRNGHFHLLSYHEARANRARKALFGTDKPLFLNKIKPPQNFIENQTYKCRVIYREYILKTDFQPYRLKPAHTLQCVYDNKLKYDHKYENRRQIESLVAQKRDTDDIIIIQNQLVTDASYSNLVFLQNGIWYTPEKPLLKGTKRAFYLDNGMIIPKEIRVKDIPQYEAVCRINAFMGLSEKYAIPTEYIRP